MRKVVKTDLSNLSFMVVTTAIYDFKKNEVNCKHVYYKEAKVDNGPNAKEEISRIIQEQRMKIRETTKLLDVSNSIKEGTRNIQSYIRIEPITEVFNLFDSNMITHTVYNGAYDWHHIHIDEKTSHIEVDEYGRSLDKVLSDSFNNYDELPF